MPRIRIALESQRKKSTGDDMITVFKFTGPGRDFSLYDLPANSPKFTFNPPPSSYLCELLLSGFHTFHAAVNVSSPNGNATTPVILSLRHRCSRLPSWSELSTWQQHLLNTLDAPVTGRAAWEGSLTDNQCASFFQITAAVERTALGARPLSDYVQQVFRVGGAEMVGQRKKGGPVIRKTGWRIHIRIPSALQATVAAGLAANGFDNDSNNAHPTHAAFGFRRSFRQKGPNPRLQIVLDRPVKGSEEASSADVDLDNGFFHLSSPIDVRDALVARFPEIGAIYQLA